jgi:hypothetical protein
VDKRSMQEVQDRNQKNYSAYLSTLNTKGSTNYRAGLFRDTIIATEYDPMATRSQYIKVRVLHCSCISSPSSPSSPARAHCFRVSAVWKSKEE